MRIDVSSCGAESVSEDHSGPLDKFLIDASTTSRHDEMHAPGFWSTLNPETPAFEPMQETSTHCNAQWNVVDYYGSECDHSASQHQSEVDGHYIGEQCVACQTDAEGLDLLRVYAATSQPVQLEIQDSCTQTDDEHLHGYRIDTAEAQVQTDPAPFRLGACDKGKAMPESHSTNFSDAGTSAANNVSSRTRWTDLESDDDSLDHLPDICERGHGAAAAGANNQRGMSTTSPVTISTEYDTEPGTALLHNQGLEAVHAEVSKHRESALEHTGDAKRWQRLQQLCVVDPGKTVHTDVSFSMLAEGFSTLDIQQIALRQQAITILVDMLRRECDTHIKAFIVQTCTVLLIDAFPENAERLIENSVKAVIRTQGGDNLRSEAVLRCCRFLQLANPEREQMLCSHLPTLRQQDKHRRRKR